MKRKLFLLILSAAILFTAGSCNKSSKYDRNFTSFESGNANQAFGAMGLEDAQDTKASRSRAAAPTSAQAARSVPRESDETGAPAGNLNEPERKLIKSASINVRVENLAAADDSVTAMLKKYDAYAASTGIDENSHYYSLRVPAIFYDFFLAETGSLGRLINRHESTEDVTLRYYDLEGRLATKKELLKTYQAYLGKAKTIEEILSVESRISELQYDIDGTGKQLRNLADRVDYATIDLYLQGPVTAASIRGLTFGERVYRLFSSFGGFLSGLAMVLLGIVVYGIPILLLLGLLYFLLFGRIGLAKKLWKIVKSN